MKLLVMEMMFNMDSLIRFGFSIDEIKNMMDTNIYISTSSDSSIKQLINILEKCKCNDKQIKSILICNPFYLNKDISSVKELIKNLKNMGFKNLNILFCANPYILNLDCNDFQEIVKGLKDKGFTDKKIIDYFNYNLVI